MLFDLVIPNYELYMENVDSLELLKGILDFYKCNKPDKPEKKPNKKLGFFLIMIWTSSLLRSCSSMA